MTTTVRSQQWVQKPLPEVLVQANIALRDEGLQMAAAPERVEARLAAHGLSLEGDDSSTQIPDTADMPSANKGTPSTATDSAGRTT